MADPGRVNSGPNGRRDEDGFHSPARRALGIEADGPGPMFTALTAALRGRGQRRLVAATPAVHDLDGARRGGQALGVRHRLRPGV